MCNHRSLPFLVLSCLTFCSIGLAEDKPPSHPSKRTGAHDYAPGVRIQWSNRQVEVTAEVVLRKGPLELLACSPQTREHESIFVSNARPLHVFQALGLIGLDPGAPVQYEEKAKRWLPPTGMPLRIDVRCEGSERTIPVQRLLRASGDEPLPKIVPWVFAGSTRDPEGRFAADLDGTLICVVDFESALITVGAAHTSDNAQLWLEANTDAIPPIGTKCTLLIAARDKDAPEIVVRIDKDGGVFWAGLPVSKDKLAERIATERDLQEKHVIQLDVVAGADKARVKQIEQILKDAGLIIRTETSKGP